MVGKSNRSEAGTTVVELALVLLVLMIVALAAVDFGMWVFQKSEAEQAAREASRVAMIDVPDGLVGSETLTSGAIYDAALAELDASLSPVITVSCSSACAPGVDVTVTVDWQRSPLTGSFFDFLHMDQVTGSSSRTVVGLPCDTC